MLSDWINMFSSSHNRTDNGDLIFIQWPDGKSYLEQCNITFEMFNIIKSIFHSNREMNFKKMNKGKV